MQYIFVFEGIFYGGTIDLFLQYFSFVIIHQGILSCLTVSEKTEKDWEHSPATHYCKFGIAVLYIA